MWASIFLCTALAALPNQAGGLKLSNVRATTGVFGSARTEEVPELLPGDSFYLNFDIENLTTDPTGLAQFNMTFELTNSKGSKIFSEGPNLLKATLALGGGRTPGFAHADIGKDTEPGDYTFKVSVSDAAVKDKAAETVTKKFKVKKADFGIVQPHLTFVGNREAFLAAPVGVIGQSLVANCIIVGITKDKDTKQPMVDVTVRILDSTGKEINQPAKQTFDKLENGTDGKPLDFIDIMYPVPLNRLGKFTIEVKAIDKLGKKEATVSFPIAVIEYK